LICDDQPAPITVDRRLVKLAIKQLLDNALKYSPVESPIVVQVHNGSGMITVAITDHGEGIPVQEQSRIFERLYRGPGTERQIPGSGLGLSIARNIARAHHGDLTVTSRAGETTFQLTLPMEQKGERR
jgi:two-component system sensor histidine kinase SenX3